LTCRQSVARYYLVQLWLKTFLILFIVSIKVLNPKLSNLLHLFVRENIHTVRRAKQTMTYHNFGEIFERLSLCKPILKWVLKHMCRYLYYWAQFLEGPFLELVIDYHYEFLKKVVQTYLTIKWFDLFYLLCVWLKYLKNDLGIELVVGNNLNLIDFLL
jgi:hypothetical protein